MKIGFLIQSLTSGGAERACCQLASQMVRKGEAVEIITFDSENQFYTPDEGVSLYDMDLKEIPKNLSAKRVFGCISRAFEIRRKIKSRNLDCLICMSTVMNSYGLISSLFTGIKSIGTERNNPYRYKSDKLNSIMKKFSAVLLDGFVFQTYESAEYYPKSVLKKGCVIQNAVFNPLVYEISPSDKREKIIYGIGRLNKQKRFDLLIKAFAVIHELFSDYSLVIFGEGEERKNLENLIDSKGLTEFVSLPGNDSLAVKKVAQGSVFVLSSDYEGMPNVLMEAMAVGTPCVSTRCKMGPEELITDEENGLLVNTGSYKEIADAVIRILSDDSLAEKLSLNSIRILETNNISAITDKWLDYIKEL